MSRSIFAIEMCLRLDPEFTAGVRRMLSADTHRQSPGDLWNKWQAVANELRKRRSLWVSGCWDFWDDAAKAQSDFQMWVQGLMTEEGARRDPSGSPDPYRSNERFMTLTMATILVRGSAAERTMASVCDIPEAYLWHANTFEKILTGIPHINFAVVERATMYLIPKDEGWGLTPEDMRLPKFEYLRAII